MNPEGKNFSQSRTPHDYPRGDRRGNKHMTPSVRQGPPRTHHTPAPPTTSKPRGETPHPHPRKDITGVWNPRMTDDAAASEGMGAWGPRGAEALGDVGEFVLVHRAPPNPEGLGAGAARATPRGARPGHVTQEHRGMDLGGDQKGVRGTETHLEWDRGSCVGQGRKNDPRKDSNSRSTKTLPPPAPAPAPLEVRLQPGKRAALHKEGGPSVWESSLPQPRDNAYGVRATGAGNHSSHSDSLSSRHLRLTLNPNLNRSP